MFTALRGNVYCPFCSKLIRILLVLSSVCKSRYESHLLRAAFSICYHGMFRVSELTTLSNVI
jgi:hypothetical protein